MVEVEASRSWSGRNRASAGCNGCWDAANQAVGGASADRHCRSWHNIAAGCCVASGEALALGVVVVASATGVAVVASSSCSSAASGMGVSAGERDAGLTVLLVVGWMDFRSWSSELAPPTAAPWPSWELKSSCEKVTGVWRRPSKDGEALLTTPAPCWNFRISSRSVRLICCAWRSAASSSLFLLSRPSTSRRFRSRDDWAARRLRRTRSTRRCSFSSSVLARFLSDC